MKVEAPGRYRLLKDFITRGSFSVGTIPAGTEIEIRKVNREYAQVIGPELGDWVHWDLPVAPILGEDRP